MNRNTPVLLYQEEENGNKTYAVAVFEDVLQYTPCENYRERRIVHVLNEKNVLSTWAEEYDTYFRCWGKMHFGEFVDHQELMECAWKTDGYNII